jgi:RND family efflux transporter, MFP subunit
MAEQSLKIANYNRQNAAIYAPADGVVLWKNAGEGEYVNPGQPVMQISLQTDKELVLRAGVNVSDWLNLSIGDKAEWKTEAFPEQVFSGKVKRIAQAADLHSGLYGVEVELAPEKQKIVVGMFVEALIHTQKQKVYKKIPCACLQDGEGRKAFVYIPDGKRVKKIPVTAAFIREGQAYISNGLDSICEVIDEGSAFLSPYSTISVQ